jgi:hypothetical protein
MTNTDKTVRLPTFDGKKKNFVMWWTRFKAYAKVQKFDKALGETEERDLPDSADEAEALDRNDHANIPALLAVARNDRALASLAVAFTTTKAMTHYHKAKDEEWPEGLAVNVVKSLLKKYCPTDTISQIEYMQRLEDFKLKKDQDPTELFDHFTEVNTQFGITDEDEKLLIAIALKKLPEKYVTAFGTLNSSLNGFADLERFEDMCESINRASKKKTTDDEEDELNLAAVGDKNNNNKNNNNNNHKNEDKCPHCGRTGHNPDKCWMLD